jgi:hypothetical protein
MMRQVLKALCVGGALFGILALASQFSGQASAQPPPPGVPLALVERLAALQQSVDALQARKFYLTVGEFDGAQAPAACAPGYHMAALWEIFDPTDLRYDRTLGFTQDDSGSGPPADVRGWIRTGRSATTFNQEGDANCNAYTSNIAEHFGSAVQLQEDWERFERTSDVAPWETGVASCGAARPVWCVQD